VRPISPLAALRSQTQSRKRQLTEGITMQTLKTILHATDFSTLSANRFMLPLPSRALTARA
jgi:hypothetical protein